MGDVDFDWEAFLNSPLADKMQEVGNLWPAEPINTGLIPDAQYGLYLSDDQITLPQPGSLPLASPYDYQSYHGEWSFRTLDGGLTDGAGWRALPALATTASYTQEFLPDATQSDMGPAAKSEQYDLQQLAAFAYCNPADLEDKSTNISESMQPLKGQCECLRCLHVGDKDYGHGCWGSGNTIACRVPGCVEAFADPGYLGLHLAAHPRHERDHFLQDGIYMCNSYNCKRSFNRWDDLVRHTSNKHCLNPKRFPCPEIGCKYSGGNGFVRKDKLTSHYKNAHEGKPRFAQRGIPRLVQPAVAAPSTSSLRDGLSAGAHEQGLDTRGNKRVRRL